MNGYGWKTNAEVAHDRYLKFQAKLKEAQAWLKAHGMTAEQFGQLTVEEQIRLYEAAKRGDTSFVTDDGRTINLLYGAATPAPTPTPIPPKVQDKLGGLLNRANDKVADVIISRGGTGSNVNEAGHWAQRTMAETAEAAVGGDLTAAKAIKLAKEAAKKGQRRKY